VYRQPWYPVEERYGLVWAYLGPPDKMPLGISSLLKGMQSTHSENGKVRILTTPWEAGEASHRLKRQEI
jgi:phenylpropionate dioxygenase-like ring-hydroxylating dioxygenase large terminal subunit